VESSEEESDEVEQGEEERKIQRELIDLDRLE
jgi:hypothetical protein